MTTHHVTEQIVRSLSKSWWVVTALLLMVGSALHFELVTEDDLGPLAAGSEVAAGETDLIAVPGELDDYPSVDYAGIKVALIDARAIPVNQTGRPIVVVDLAIENQSDVQARVPLAMLKLVRTDGRTFTAERFEYTEHSNRVSISPGDVDQALVVFKLPPGRTGAVSSYELEIGEAGRWPVMLGLDGSASEPDFPQPLALADSSVGAEAAQYQGLRVELLDAVTALEHGVYRAPVGQHLAVISVRVVGASAGIDRNLWTMADQNGESRAIRASIVEASADGTDATVEVVFSYSTGMSELSLFVGRSDTRDLVATFETQAFE